jgi:hypothetical protein
MTRPSVAAALPVLRSLGDPRPVACDGFPLTPLADRCQECLSPLCDDGSRCPACHGRGIGEDVRRALAPAPRCFPCLTPLDPADVVDLAGVPHCLPCAERETGEGR